MRQVVEHFQDIKAALATFVRSNEDLSAALPLTFTLTLQPDVPRKLTWTFDSHAQITAFTITFTGVNAKGEAISQVITAADGWTGTTAEAYATITSIIMSARTGTGAADTMDIGISDKIGLANRIPAASWVYKAKKASANYPASSYTVDAVYDTVDLSTGGAVTDNDDFTIWYKTP